MRLRRTAGEWKVDLTPRPHVREEGDDDAVYADTPELMAIGLDVVSDRLNATSDEIAAGKYPTASAARPVLLKRMAGHDPGDEEDADDEMEDSAETTASEPLQPSAYVQRREGPRR